MIFIIMGPTNGQTQKLTVVSGIGIKCMDLVKWSGQMVDNLLVILLIIKDVELDILYGQTEGNIMVIKYI